MPRVPLLEYAGNQLQQPKTAGILEVGSYVLEASPDHLWGCPARLFSIALTVVHGEDILFPLSLLKDQEGEDREQYMSPIFRAYRYWTQTHTMTCDRYPYTQPIWMSPYLNRICIVYENRQQTLGVHHGQCPNRLNLIIKLNISHENIQSSYIAWNMKWNYCQYKHILICRN